MKQFANPWLRWSRAPHRPLLRPDAQRPCCELPTGSCIDTNSGPAIFLNQQGYFTHALTGSLDGSITPDFNWQSGVPVAPAGPYFIPPSPTAGEQTGCNLMALVCR